jgi:hypothetical protein
MQRENTTTIYVYAIQEIIKAIWRRKKNKFGDIPRMSDDIELNLTGPLLLM